jgi:hypothetical protein
LCYEVGGRKAGRAKYRGTSEMKLISECSFPKGCVYADVFQGAAIYRCPRLSGSDTILPLEVVENNTPISMMDTKKKIRKFLLG